MCAAPSSQNVDFAAALPSPIVVRTSLALLIALGGCGRLGFDLQPLPAQSPECTPLRVADSPYANSSEGADGTEAGTPFLLCTEVQLDNIAQHPEHWASAFRLAGDLTLQNTVVPIASKTAPFGGAFDGGGHTLAKLKIDLPMATGVGLFAYLGAGAHVHDLSLTGVDVRGASSVGAIAGSALGARIDHITMSGMVTGTGNSIGGLLGDGDGDNPTDTPMTMSDIDVNIVLMGGGNMGGVAGILASGGVTSTISNVTVAGTITGDSTIGGAVGNFNAIIDNATSSTTMNCISDCGGLIGSSFLTAEIRNSSASGKVTCTGAVCGGLAADDTSLISHSFATGDVTCSSIECGGLAAAPLGPVEYSYATGNVTGTDLAAGLLAAPAQPFDIHDCYATGTVIGRDEVGGLLGNQIGGTTLSNSYATGAVSGRDHVGGLVGDGGSSTTTLTIKDSFATGNVSGMSASNSVSRVLGFTYGSVSLNGVYSLTTATCTNTAGTCTTDGAPVADVTMFYSASNVPLSAWDFTTVWSEVPGDFPALR